MLSNYVTSGIRTITPMVVAWVLVHVSFVANLATTEQAQTAVAFALASLWYLVVRAAETRWPNGFKLPGVPFTIDLGWLLGVPAKPTYAK